MTFSDDCPMGRSQLFTFRAKETITVDRATIQRLLTLLNRCAMELSFVEGNSIFPESVQAYLSGIDSLEGNKALTLLKPWTDTVPESLEDITETVVEAKRTIEFLLADSARGQHD